MKEGFKYYAVELFNLVEKSSIDGLLVIEFRFTKIWAYLNTLPITL